MVMSIDDYLFFNDPADMGNDDPFDIDMSPDDIVVGLPEEWY
jgi:hypothetical protein